MSDKQSDRALSCAIQTVLFENPVRSVERMLIGVERAAAVAATRHPNGNISVWLGDCSPRPLLSPAQISALQAAVPALDISYEHFDTNLGHAAAQNRLAGRHNADYVVTMNPDVVLAPDALDRLLNVMTSDASIGIVDGKQLPLEHPKIFDRHTGETSWCSGALSLVRGQAFRAVEGFDSDAFFMHGDDVDLSWRLRQAGWKAMHHPGAVGFHDRRLSRSASMVPSVLERHYSAESALMLAYLWGATERLAQLRRGCQTGDDHVLAEALISFDAKRTSGTLRSPEAHPPPVVSFDGDTYGGHRW